MVLNICFHLVGVEHRITSSYHSSTNGQVEKLNHTLIQSLKRHIEDDKTNWDKC